MELPAIARRESLSDAVATSLESWIRDGEVAPGDKLPPEHELASRMGVSRPVLREALARLKGAGLVESRRGSGLYRSADPHPGIMRISRWEADSLDNVRKIFELRSHLEAGAAELAAERRSDKALAGIEKALVLQRAAAQDGVKEDLAFHFAVARASENEYFLRVLELLSSFLAASMRQSGEDPAAFKLRKARVEKEHQVIYEAIRDRNPKAAARAARQHMERAWARIAR